MDTAAQWPPHQEIVVKPMEEIVKASSVERSKVRPQKEEALNCPRCNSTNTKFCYYNNYSLTQPRYFCKTCRRYWTEGGSLRNIPVGGGSRKNKRSSKKQLPADLEVQNPKVHDQDLNLGFSVHHNHDFKSITDMIQNNPSFENNPNSLELFNSFVPAPTSDYSSGFPNLPSLTFSLDNYATFPHPNGKLLFPFQDLKQPADRQQINNNRGQNGDNATGGYWNGVIGGGGSW